MARNEDDFFPPEEATRRFNEVLLRCCGAPATFDLLTGQNIGEPKLSAEKLLRRGYDGSVRAWWKIPDEHEDE